MLGVTGNSHLPCLVCAEGKPKRGGNRKFTMTMEDANLGNKDGERVAARPTNDEGSDSEELEARCDAFS